MLKNGNFFNVGIEIVKDFCNIVKVCKYMG